MEIALETGGNSERASGNDSGGQNHDGSDPRKRVCEKPGVKEG